MSRILCYRAFLGAALAWSATAFAQPSPDAPPELTKLKTMVGTWDAAVQVGPETSKAVSTYHFDVGGKWLVGNFEGEFGEIPFHGMGIDGYDPVKKKYISVWFDSMSPAPAFFEGEFDPSGKVLTQFSKGPGHDGKEVITKSTTQYIDNDHVTFTMYMIGDNKSEAEVMKIEYTRRKE